MGSDDDNDDNDNYNDDPPEDDDDEPAEGCEDEDAGGDAEEDGCDTRKRSCVSSINSTLVFATVITSSFVRWMDDLLIGLASYNT